MLTGTFATYTSRQHIHSSQTDPSAGFSFPNSKQPSILSQTLADVMIPIPLCCLRYTALGKIIRMTNKSSENRIVAYFTKQQGCFQLYNHLIVQRPTPDICFAATPINYPLER